MSFTSNNFVIVVIADVGVGDGQGAASAGTSHGAVAAALGCWEVLAVRGPECVVCRGSLPENLDHGSAIGGSATLVAPAGSAGLESLPVGKRLSPGTNAAGGLIGVLLNGVLLMTVS